MNKLYKEIKEIFTTNNISQANIVINNENYNQLKSFFFAVVSASPLLS